MRFMVIAVLVMLLTTSVYGFEKKACLMREDFDTEPLYDCTMNYYYYIPCPTYSWFWALTGWNRGDRVGVMFTVGDPSMSSSLHCPPYAACDPYVAHRLEKFRILDFTGYGTVYPGLHTVEFGIWCADEQACPVGPPLWSSSRKEMCVPGWNYILVTPPLCLTSCYTQAPPECYPRFIITATMVGFSSEAVAWGLDGISMPLNAGCAMHDIGCCPALYPRPYVSHYNMMHSGYYGQGFQYCPPLWFLDGYDHEGGQTYGFIELAWRAYLVNIGPSDVQPTNWGTIKAIYR